MINNQLDTTYVQQLKSSFTTTVRMRAKTIYMLVQLIARLLLVRPYLLDLMLRGPDRLYFFSNEIILKITCADHVMT